MKSYVSVEAPAGLSYGGSQTWFSGAGGSRRESVLSAYGCGVVALGDFLLAAGREHPVLLPSLEQRCFRPFRGGEEDGILDRRRYLTYLESLEKSYLPIFPRLGANAWQLWLAMALYFRRSGFKRKVRWGAFSWNIPKKVRRMLEQGMPAVLSVGPNLNPLDREQRVPLYQFRDGVLMEAARVRGHYMNITGMYWDQFGELFFQVSSWGNCFYLPWRAYRAYRRRQIPLLGQWVSNILLVE